MVFGLGQGSPLSGSRIANFDGWLLALWFDMFQVGLDLTTKDQIDPLLGNIQKKLLFRSTAHLSLAGRVVVANQVLLATMWHITSYWIFASFCII